MTAVSEAAGRPDAPPRGADVRPAAVAAAYRTARASARRLPSPALRYLARRRRRQVVPGVYDTRHARAAALDAELAARARGRPRALP